ncbi:MAG: PhnD/SsuA/transferrin family substrate-binding protein [Firmicutes bacterium]|nr:phosphate/phosphite/phosphonate ABC transporter substrate-binding protein [Ezakiella sp.]MDD7761490.1 PhnD/SsuA/transferrin family substrate-binding protein [Bacillota bacterium]
MLRIGAVIYDPRVTVVWELIEKFFDKAGMKIEPVFFKDYKMQVDALVAGEIDMAWNSPLAHLDVVLRTDGKYKYSLMRDTDQDRKTMLIVRRGEITDVSELKGKTIGFGALDSPQARLIPINYLHENNLEFGKDYTEKRFDIGVGLHGDHIGGEMEAAKALTNGEVDAAFVLDLNWEAWKKDGTVDDKKLSAIGETKHFDHCIFDYRPEIDDEVIREFEDIMLQMDYNKPEDKEILDLEGLKEWKKGRLSGYEQISSANEYLRFL